MNAVLLADDWEIVTQRTNEPFLFWLLMLVAIPLWWIPPTYSSITWTIRHRPTGVVRRVTAHSLSEATEKVLQGAFDLPDVPEAPRS
jgi:hypothetical protein